MSAAPSHPAAPALARLLAAYEDAWRSNDPAALKALWDRSRPPVYLAEEIEDYLADWRALERYWVANQSAHAQVRLSFSRSLYADMATDLVLGLHQMAWSIAFKNKPAMGGNNRVAALYRKCGASWRFAAWIEAPLAPIVYLRKLYEDRASE